MGFFRVSVCYIEHNFLYQKQLKVFLFKIGNDRPSILQLRAIIMIKRGRSSSREPVLLCIDPVYCMESLC